ncbi:PB1 domain containing protein [Acanthamoeba castellanii str. Neff]|uniref:PB1 domain containing protein n=1 Tax=Acanthamoeba castellanii (strain ATCC 30010 / Neff) TaxID=1257118 RepID=L8GZZ7_ACACF|nr:PB1 domain containing protein [Acanthamoeba castellanii str. Neff]ELR17681.1 PB1 domain containing protein [Acanthamoeba castellanii str. Neff]
MHEKRARSNTPTTTSSTRAENVAATNPLAVGEGSGSGSGSGTSTSTTTAGGLGGYLVMASPSTSPPSHHESEALARLKRANLTLRERKNEERTRTGATSGDLPAFAPAHLHLSPRRPSSADTRPRASSTEKKEKREREKSTRKWKKKSGEPAQHKKAPVEEWRPKEVAKWLQAIELGDYAKAARKKKVDGAQLVKVVDTILSTSPSAGHADHHADGGVVLAALGVKKLGHLKRLQRELRQAMLDSNGGGDDGGENEDGDNNDDDGAEENEEERRKQKAAGKLPIPRGHSAPIAVTASLPVASSPNRLLRLVHNLSGSSTTPSSLSSSPSATSLSPSSSSLAPSSVSFPAIDSDSDSFLSGPTPTLSSTSSPSSPAAGDGATSHGRPRTRSKLIERLATGMPRSRSAESPLPLTSTSTSTSSSPLSGSPSLGRSGSGFGFGGNGGNGGGGSCPLPAVVVSPPLSPSGKRPSNSANFIAVAHGTSTLFDGDDDSSGSTISTISTSSSSSSSSSLSGNNMGATFSFSFPSSSSSSSHSASSISATWDASPTSCTSLAFCSMFGEVAIKCVVDDDISLVRLNLETDLSLSGLHRAIERVYGQRMRAHYFDSEGDKIRITTDSSLRYAYEDWCQALERSGATISWRLHLKPRSKARAHSDTSSGPLSSLSISASASPSMSMDVVADYVADEAAM